MRSLENAIVRLLKRRPFYGHLLLGFRRRETTAGSAIGATLKNGTPTLNIREEAFSAYNPAEQEALLEHVLKHILHLHPLRRRGRNGGSWDAACDLVINPSIERLPAGAALPERFGLETGLAAEEYYQWIARPFDSGNLEGEGFGNAARDSGKHRDAASDGSEETGGGGALAEFSPLDDHRVWEEADSTPAGLGEEAVRGLVREACRHSGGEIPGDLREMIDQLLAVPAIPWRQVLRQFVANAGRVGRKSSWKREHRRFAHDTPGMRKRRRLNLLVGIDVSDSTDERPVREAFARELVRIARGRESQITVLYAGSRIQRIDSFRGSAAVAEVYHGGGFTDLRPVFDYARQMHPRPAAVIYLTDGYGEAPSAMEYPTLWVLTPEGRKPADWGVELRLVQS